MANGIYNNGARPRQQRSRTFKVWVSGDNCQRLMVAASKRGVTPDRLLETLVRYVLEGGLIEAVLDDDRPAEEAVAAVKGGPAAQSNPSE
jgi:hypothetical protein